MVDYIILQLTDCLDIFGEQTVKIALKNFSCANDHDLEAFLAERAITYEESAKGKTFLALDEKALNENGELTVIAYYTLANTSIDLANFSDNRKKKVVGDFPNRTK